MQYMMCMYCIYSLHMYVCTCLPIYVMYCIAFNRTGDIDGNQQVDAHTADGSCHFGPFPRDVE